LEQEGITSKDTKHYKKRENAMKEVTNTFGRGSLDLTVVDYARSFEGIRWKNLCRLLEREPTNTEVWENLLEEDRAKADQYRKKWEDYQALIYSRYVELSKLKIKTGTKKRTKFFNDYWKNLRATGERNGFAVGSTVKLQERCVEIKNVTKNEKVGLSRSAVQDDIIAASVESASNTK
jgi:hypothetical protein